MLDQPSRNLSFSGIEEEPVESGLSFEILGEGGCYKLCRPGFWICGLHDLLSLLGNERIDSLYRPYKTFPYFLLAPVC